MARASPPEDAAGRFEREARASGLSLPTSRALDPKVAAAVVAIVVAASFAVGYSTNWFNLSRPAPNPLAALPGCTNGGVSLHVVTEANASSSLSSLWPQLTSSFSAATGGCLSVVSSASEAGPGALTSTAVDSVVGPEVPNGTAAASLVGATFDVPLLVSPVVVVANLGGHSTELNLTAAAIAGAYLGSVQSWANPQLTASNPGLHSDLNVTAVHLAGPSTADAVFTTFLAERNSSFGTAVGSGPNVTWPTGLSASSPGAEESIVAATPGAIGFEPTDVCPALPIGVVCASLGTASGGFVAPTPASVAAAAAAEANSSAAVAGAWSNVSGVAPASSSVYPMVETTCAVVYKDLGTAYGGALGLNESKWLIALLFWIASDTAGSAGVLAAAAGYSTLPAGMAITAEETALNVTYLGNWILIPASALQEGAAEGGNETGEF